MELELTLKPELATWLQYNAIFCRELTLSAQGICDERWKLLNGIINGYDVACGIDKKLGDGCGRGLKYLEDIKHCILSGSVDEKAKLIRNLLSASEMRVKSVPEPKSQSSTLVKCSECGHDVSMKAAVCPHCGMPVKEMTNSIKFDYEYTGDEDCLLSEDQKKLFPLLMMDAIHNPIQSTRHERAIRFFGELFDDMPIPFLYRWTNKIIGMIVASIAIVAVDLIDRHCSLPEIFYWFLVALAFGLWFALTRAFHPKEIRSQLYYCSKVRELLLDVQRCQKVSICLGKAIPVGIESSMRRQVYDLIYAYFKDRDIKQLAEFKAKIFCYFYKGIIEIKYSPKNAGKILFQD